MGKKVEDVIELGEGDTPPRNPEAATDALEQVVFNADDSPPPPPNTAAPDAPRRRRTKAELEAEVARLNADMEKARAALCAASNPYGDGQASPRIAAAVVAHLEGHP